MIIIGPPDAPPISRSLPDLSKRNDGLIEDKGLLLGYSNEYVIASNKSLGMQAAYLRIVERRRCQTEEIGRARYREIIHFIVKKNTYA